MYSAIMQEEGTVRRRSPDFLRSRSLAAPSGMKMRDDSCHRGREGCYLSALLFRAMIIQAGRNQGDLHLWAVGDQNSQMALKNKC